MNRFGLLLVTLLPAAALAAPSEPAPRSVDVTPFAKSLAVYHDGKGHYFVVHHPLTETGKAGDRLFYGDGKRFYLQPVPGRSRNGEDASYSINEPRVAGGAYSSFARRKGKVSFTCENRETPLRELEAKQAAAMIKAASFHDIYFLRRPYVLARDSAGRYFYVDRLFNRNIVNPSEYRAGDFRVFSGMRGKLKPLRMKNVVSDSSGEIFITPDGQLKLILDKSGGKSNRSTAHWISRGKKTELTLVEVETYNSVMMIFRDLGPYSGQRLERPCDDF